MDYLEKVDLFQKEIEDFRKQLIVARKNKLDKTFIQVLKGEMSIRNKFLTEVIQREHDARIAEELICTEFYQIELRRDKNLRENLFNEYAEKRKQFWKPFGNKTSDTFTEAHYRVIEIRMDMIRELM